MKKLLRTLLLTKEFKPTVICDLSKEIKTRTIYPNGKKEYGKNGQEFYGIKFD